jgi:hypothetical protein
MVPYERLRALARWSEPDDVLLAEIADCLAELGDDPAATVVACRRLLDHHRSWGALWWLSCRVLAAPQPAAAAMEALAEVARDETFHRLAGALPSSDDHVVAVIGWPPIARYLMTDRPDVALASIATEDPGERLSASAREIDLTELPTLAPGHLLVQPFAMSERRSLVTRGNRAVLAASPVSTRVWAVAPTGSVMPDPVLDAMRAAVTAVEECPVERFDRIAGPERLDPPEAIAGRIDTPVAPELLRPLP